MRKYVLFFLVLLTFSCFSCMTLQQDVAVSIEEELSPEIIQIEQELAFMHAEYILDGKKPTIEKADALIKHITG